MPSSDSDNFMCLICHGIVRDCRNANCCGALLCGECVDNNHMANCPNCRKVNVSFSRNIPMQRLADDLDVQCDDCGQTYKHSSDHTSWCPFHKIKCPFDSFLVCEWKGRRKLLESHIKEKHTPRCPEGTPMQKTISTNDAWYCDVCHQTIATGLLAMADGINDYCECAGCFSGRPLRCIGDSLGRQDRKRRGEEDVSDDDE